MRAVWISAVLLFIGVKAFAQNAAFNGRIADSHNHPLPYVSVWINNIQKGTLSNTEGVFKLNIKPGAYTITFRTPGYQPLVQSFNIRKDPADHLIRLSKIQAADTAFAAADSIIQKTIASRKDHLEHMPDYAGVLYSKSLQRLGHVPKIFLKKDIAHVLQLNPYRKGIINLSEYTAAVQIRSTDYLKADVNAARIVINSRDLFDFNKSPELRVDFYENALHFYGFNEHGFLSPIADDAFKYYRYKLVAQFKDNGRVIDVIRVTPVHRLDEHLFSGTIGIAEGDWQLYNVDLQVGRHARMDFIDSIRIQQQFVPVTGGSWMPQAMAFNFYGKFLSFKYSGLFLRAYQQLQPDTAALIPPINRLFYSTKPAYQKPDTFWNDNRALTLTPEEEEFYYHSALTRQHIIDKHLTDSLQNKNNRFRLLPYLLRGYTLHNYRNNSAWFFQSPYNMVFYNTVEGWGFDIKPRYVKVLDSLHSLTIIPEVRYGFSDHVPNANVFVNYVYDPFKHGSIYARVGTDFLDLNNTGTISLFLNTLNTLFYGDNYLKLYQSRFIMAGTDREVANGILLNGSFEYANRRSVFNTNTHTFNKDSVLLTSNNPLNPNGNTPLFPEYRAFIFQGSATITFDQDYMTTPAGKFILPNPYPRLRVNFREGIPALGSDVNYSFLSVDVFQDRLNMGVWGYTSYFVSAGDFLNAKSLYYPDYKQFSGGESFFFNSTIGSFHFLNYYTYSTDKAYFEAHAEHNFCGLLLSRIPLLDELNLQEIIGGSFLTQGTLPDYKEVYIGLKHTAIRVDYGFAFGRYSSVIQGFRLVYNL